MLATISRDLKAVMERDPAARTKLEVALLYPGVHAIWGHRICHWLWHSGHRMAARSIAFFLRSVTGVEIHPAAVIGSGFFIDHAMGVVIGETAVVGEDVTIYHGVTLGGRGTESGKRHPTIGDRVVVGAGAKVLGAITVGSDSRIGANAVVVRDVPPNSVVVGIPGQVVSRTAVTAPVKSLNGTNGSDPVLPDLLGRGLASLINRVDELESLVVGHTSQRQIRPDSEGVWAGDDFSI